MTGEVRVSARQQVAVLGLGRFGQAVARELTRIGHDVLAVDADAAIVQGIADDVTHAVRADITDRDALEQLGLAQFDAAIIAASSKLEVSILATVLTKQPDAEAFTNEYVTKALETLKGEGVDVVGSSFTPQTVTLNAGGA